MARIHYGTHRHLEEEANRLLKESLKGVTSHKAKSDLLTPWKEAERHRREVYVQSGAPDVATRKGMFHRIANKGRPDLNSRDGLARSNRVGTGGLQAFIDENGYEATDD